MGFFDTIGKILGGVSEVVGDSARHSSDPSLALQYIDLFNRRVEQADLETLEKMLDRREYAVDLDSQNDYARQRRIEDRLQTLRRQRYEQVERERQAYDRWLSEADIDELESGLSSGKYQIRYDSQNDAERRERLEKKLRPLREKRRREQEQADLDAMKRLCREYLERTEARLYQSYYVYQDFRQELSCLPEFQQEVLDEVYAAEVQELLAKPREELEEVLANSAWQVRKQKLVAGKSLLLLILAQRSAEGEVRSLIEERLADMEEAVLRNTFAPYWEEGDEALSGDALLQKGNEAKIAGEPHKAAACYLLAAQKENAEAMGRLGLCFLYGLGAPEDNDKAFFWLEKSAERKSPIGLYGLGVCYRFGYGAEADIQQAEEAYRKAVSLGGSGGAAGEYGLGLLYEHAEKYRNPEEAFQWYRKAAEHGCLEGSYCVYVLYSNGTGVEKDDEAAAEWFARTVEAADREDSALDITSYAAFNDLGRAYHNGWLGTGGADESRALTWFRRGTAVGYRTSKTWLVDFNEYESANRIFHELEGENYTWAFSQLADAYTGGSGVPKDQVTANYYHLKAAKYGKGADQYHIAKAFLEGAPGIRQDDREAVRWLEKAAANGVAEAQEELAKRREQEEQARREEKAAQIQARRDGVLKKKASLDGQMSGLAQRLREIEDKIDRAASEKEEAAAIAEKEGVQGEIDKLRARIEAAEAELAKLENGEESSET